MAWLGKQGSDVGVENCTGYTIQCNVNTNTQQQQNEQLKSPQYLLEKLFLKRASGHLLTGHNTKKRPGCLGTHTHIYYRLAVVGGILLAFKTHQGNISYLFISPVLGYATVWSQKISRAFVPILDTAQ